MAEGHPAVAEIVELVMASPKYARLDPSLVAALAAQEAAKTRRSKEAVKQVKNRLHQSVAAYWQGSADFARWQELLQTTADEASRRAALRALLGTHHSTRERLPFLDTFYQTLFAGLPPPSSVLDLGCGLNPLALPWMGLPATTRYYACDVDHGQVAFLKGWLALAGQPGQAFVCNLLAPMPPASRLLPTDAPASDVALLLKILPCLEQLDRHIGPRLLAGISAATLIVSFPAQSLGGKGKGMVQHYSGHMAQLVEGRPWQVERFEFPSELVFRLRRGDL